MRGLRKQPVAITLIIAHFDLASAKFTFRLMCDRLRWQTRLTQRYLVSLVVSQLGRRDRITPDNATTPGALPCLNPMPEQSHVVFHALQHLPLIPVQKMQCFGQQLLVPRLVANLLASAVHLDLFGPPKSQCRPWVIRHILIA